MLPLSRKGSARRGPAVLILAVAAVATLTPAEAAPPFGAVEVFAHIPGPEGPEGILVSGERVFVGTHAPAAGNRGEGPSVLYEYDLATGALVDEQAIDGQNLTGVHGILAMAPLAAGGFLLLDRNPPRLLRIDPDADTQATYATFPDLPACTPPAPADPCAPVTVDEPAFPDFVAMTEDGTAYVTDFQAATIFRVPAGGGAAEVWFQSPLFDGIFGLNGIAVAPDGEHLVFAMTGSQQPSTPAQAVIYRLPIEESPDATDLEQLFVYDVPASGVDGIRFGASGLLYTALAGTNQVSVLDLATGAESRYPPDALANSMQAVPFDNPASIDFDDGRGALLVTNQSYFTATSENWAVLRVPVADTGMPFATPDV
jgi:DNA-binding beta-propeller fold protein YncE